MEDDGTLVGTKRLHDTTRKLPETGAAAGNVFNKKLTHFNSQTGRCNIEKSPWSLFSDYWEWLSPKGNELWCTSGRTNERWQSGFDDRRRPYIVQRWPDNYVEIHPDDAKARGVESGDMLMVYSDRVPNLKETTLGVESGDYTFSGQMKAGNVELTRGAVTGVAMVTRHIKKGLIFMDFLHTSQPANALEGRIVDGISGNYNFKMGVANVKKIGESPYKKTFRSMSFAPRDIT